MNGGGLHEIPPMDLRFSEVGFCLGSHLGWTRDNRVVYDSCSCAREINRFGSKSYSYLFVPLGLGFGGCISRVGFKASCKIGAGHRYSSEPGVTEMTRNDRLIKFIEINALVAKCKGCGAEIHISIKYGHKIGDQCPVCAARIEGMDQQTILDVVKMLDGIRSRDLKSVELTLNVPANPWPPTASGCLERRCSKN